MDGFVEVAMLTGVREKTDAASLGEQGGTASVEHPDVPVHAPAQPEKMSTQPDAPAYAPVQPTH